MRNVNERPLCHRAEDLVTYLYGEASEADAADFADHMRLCDACRSEFAVFHQVHDSILQWRSEALGAVSFAGDSAPVTSTAVPAVALRPETRLSAMAAIREFFNVSPLWLRGVAALASVLFCVLVALAIARFWQAPSQVAVRGSNEKTYTEQELKDEVNKQVNQQLAARASQNPTTQIVTGEDDKPVQKKSRRQNQIGSQFARTRLNREEREQLAADLRLLPTSEEDELPFVLPNEMNW